MCENYLSHEVLKINIYYFLKLISKELNVDYIKEIKISWPPFNCSSKPHKTKSRKRKKKKDCSKPANDVCKKDEIVRIGCCVCSTFHALRDYFRYS